MSTLLDTNVLSELLRSAPEPMVLEWFAAQPSETLFVSAVTQAEMLSHCSNHRRQDERRKAPGRAGGPRDHRQQHAGQLEILREDGAAVDLVPGIVNEPWVDAEEILDVPGQTVQRFGTATLLNKCGEATALEGYAASAL